LHGPAGAGKSAIPQMDIIRKVAATFFFYRTDPAHRNQPFTTTTAWQLAFSIPGIKNLIVGALDKAPHLSTKGVE
ncbi:hypothetical protein JOM56_002610, partial [Amanita muscaria]